MCESFLSLSQFFIAKLPTEMFEKESDVVHWSTGPGKESEKKMVVAAVAGLAFSLHISGKCTD